MYRVFGTTIQMTRGDTVIVQIGIKRNGEPYIPVQGDVIRFAMKHPAMTPKKTRYVDTDPILIKLIPNDILQLRLDPQDTAELDFGDYVYDIQITFEDGSVDTFIAEAKLQLLPEVG